MNLLQSLLGIALLAALASSCRSDEPAPYVPPQLELNKPYYSTKIISEGLHLGIRDKWIIWEQDSVLIKAYMNRVLGEENNPGFLPASKTLQISQTQQVVFTSEGATYTENGQQTSYAYQPVYQSGLVWMQQRDTLSYYENEKHAVIDRLGYFKPVYHTKELATDNEDYKYKVRTVAERYFSMLTNGLWAPGMHYHIKTYENAEEWGHIQNYLGDQGAILRSIPLGDTLLIQLYRMDYAY
jgi:hypothetical protein